MNDQFSEFEVFPYQSSGETMNMDGAPTDYRFTLEDFSDALLGQRNSLAWPWEQWQSALEEFDGDKKRALTYLGLDCPPDTPAVAFAKLQSTWHENGLFTGYQVLKRYLLADIKPALNITQRRHQMIVDSCGVSPYRDHVSVSSFAFQTMLRMSMDGSSSQQLRLFPLGPKVTHAIRQNITGCSAFLNDEDCTKKIAIEGGYSWATIRYLERNMRVPPQRLNYETNDGIPEDEMELVSNIVSLDANCLY